MFNRKAPSPFSFLKLRTALMKIQSDGNNFSIRNSYRKHLCEASALTSGIIVTPGLTPQTWISTTSQQSCYIFPMIHFSLPDSLVGYNSL